MSPNAFSPKTHPELNVVFFDCDSTLSAIEGVDELAQWKGVAPMCEALTRDAMDGKLALQDVWGKRLVAINPTEADIEKLGQSYIDRAVDGVRETIGVLTKLGKDVHIVSGGIRQAIEPFAQWLGVSDHHVHAVVVTFDGEGYASGFETNPPLWRNGGKADVCREVLGDSRRHSAMVGDGVTDMEASDVCDVVVGYGGVVARRSVEERADVFVKGAFVELLDVLLTPSERRLLNRD